MSAFVCSLSGAPLICPVVSTKTGHLFEESTIHQYISANGTCPHSGTNLAVSDLVRLAQPGTTVLPGQQGVPNLSEKMVSEMEVLVLEAHMLKEKLRERR